MTGQDATPDGAAQAVRTEIESSGVIAAVKVFVSDVVAVSPAPTVADVVFKVMVSAIAAAVDGPDDRTPMPSATTTASAMRLKPVLLDICFLSEVVYETFSQTAGREKLSAS